MIIYYSKQIKIRTSLTIIASSAYRWKGLPMAGKNKVEFKVRIDETLYKKLLAAAERDNSSLNNHMLRLIRTNVEYSERIRGKIDVSKVKLPEEESEESK